MTIGAVSPSGCYFHQSYSIHIHFSQDSIQRHHLRHFLMVGLSFGGVDFLSGAS